MDLSDCYAYVYGLLRAIILFWRVIYDVRSLYPRKMLKSPKKIATTEKIPPTSNNINLIGIWNSSILIAQNGVRTDQLV